MWWDNSERRWHADWIDYGMQDAGVEKPEAQEAGAKEPEDPPEHAGEPADAEKLA